MKYHERARAILRSGLRAPVRLVLLAISDHWNEKTSECFPSIDTLVAETGLDERTVQRAVRDLVAFGAVTRDVELGVRTVYHLHLEALPPAEERPKKVRPPRQRVTPGPVTPPAESHPTPGRESPDPRQPDGGPPAESHPNGSGTIQLIEPRNVPVARARATPNLVPIVWDALMTLYVDSGHGRAPLELDEAGHRESLTKCLRALHKDQREAAFMMVHTMAYQLYGPNSWQRDNLPGSELIAALLAHTKIGMKHTRAKSWEWDKVVGPSAGPSTGPVKPTKQSNYKRQRDALLREIEEEERAHGNTQIADSGDGHSPGGRVLQLAPGG